MRQVLSRQVLGKGMLTAAAASSLLSIATGAASAHPGASAEVSRSPGVLSGNSVSVPITFAPNVCGNSVDGGAALNPSMGNTCATATGPGAHQDHDYRRHLSPENAEAFERHLDERRARHAMPEQRHEVARDEAPRQGPRHAAPRHAAPRHEEPRHQESPHQGGYGAEQAEEECDDHPRSVPPPAPAPEPVPDEAAPQPLPAPAPDAQEDAPRPPHGSQPVDRPAPAPAPEAVRPPADQPPAAPAGDAPVHLTPAPAPATAPASSPAPVPAPVQTPAPARATGMELAETGAGQPAAAAALASALILGGAILYRRSRTA
ncbi:chaplin [Streptomyces sp. NPDC058674]|uniref:chaplin n=1 Tax=Streptomyces sp. NPDC058674 TaxID=3346592 RepID=UPI00364F5CDF